VCTAAESGWRAAASGLKPLRCGAPGRKGERKIILFDAGNGQRQHLYDCLKCVSAHTHVYICTYMYMQIYIGLLVDDLFAAKI